MQAKLEKAMRKAIRFLEQEKIRYAVIGGVAVSQWGYDRYSEDVDFKIYVPSSDFPAMRALLRKKFPINAREHLPPNAPVVAVRIDDVTIDFGLGYPGFDEIVIERAVTFTIKGAQVRIATAEDLIILKIIAERGKDWIDVEELTKKRYQELDFAYIYGWLKEFAEWLEQPDMIARYDEIVAQAKVIHSKK